MLHLDLQARIWQVSTLDLDSAVQSLALLLCPGNSLLPHDTSAPVTFGFLVLV